MKAQQHNPNRPQQWSLFFKGIGLIWCLILQVGLLACGTEPSEDEPTSIETTLTGQYASDEASEEDADSGDQNGTAEDSNDGPAEEEGDNVDEDTEEDGNDNRNSVEDEGQGWGEEEEDENENREEDNGRDSTCLDSDEGINLTVAGAAKGIHEETRIFDTYADRCADAPGGTLDDVGGFLMEQHCSATTGRVHSYWVECVHGCVNGACLESAPNPL